MESVLEDRDRVGVADAILLEDFKNVEAFCDNLHKRYMRNIIYTYIGQVLVTVNPYKDLGLYTDAAMETYRRANFYQVPPSVFAIAETAFRSMIAENEDQCILISGESGAGKTEASKQILRYVAAATLHQHEIDHVRDRLLKSNPVLEAFGNAKTNRNDNSSRFGKYMDIECNFKGDPLGGHILNYLLEKSRVVHQENGERNFHVFYQLLAGSSEEVLAKLHLTRDPADYHYLRQGNSSRLTSVDDKSEFEKVLTALKVIEFGDDEITSINNIVAAILHMGNIIFTANDEGNAIINSSPEIKHTSELLSCSESTLTAALTHRTIEARDDIVCSPLSVEQAQHCRDALAKSTYERLFNWLVERLNASLRSTDKAKKTLFGILDIYGFEIFERNGYEQFCINYCNEKLQQVFIELTLRSEQEEYRREGIVWEQVPYFDNKIICDLVEEKHKGIISVMDEECLRPGDATDLTLLAKLNAQLGKHDHFSSYETVDINDKQKKTFGNEEFRLRHYAGEVSYNIRGFLDKNNDLLYRDLKQTMTESGNPILAKVFPKKELVAKKRPVTAATQFKLSLSKLMDILMSKQPSYIRCIKPNEHKRALDFNRELVTHQVKYLGLMENLRVRRAGFAYRRNYEIFLERYKSLCPKTWPNFKGPAKDGVQHLVESLKFSADEYRMGNTKIFIRLPKTLFRTEDAYQVRKGELATFLQARVKCFIYRRKFLAMKAAVTLIAAHWRTIAAKKILQKRRWAAIVIRAFVKGFITRNEAVNETNARFQKLVKSEWLLRLSKSLPRNVLDNFWPEAPVSCQGTSAIIKTMHHQCLAGRYVRTLPKDRKKMFEEKILAEQLFKDRKVSYRATLPKPFKATRLSTVEENLLKTAFENVLKHPGEKTKYSVPCTKYDRHGYAPRERLLIVTTGALYLLESNKDSTKLKLKHRFPLKDIHRLTVSPNNDTFVLIQTPHENYEKDKGDLILRLPNVIEAITKIVTLSDNPDVVNVADSNSIEHYMKNGKAGTIRFDTGTVSSFDKTKDGTFVVVAAQ
uniref:Myosin-IB-like n=1 Tax=Hirondellea gigas TaxID=1518452 RepID=A0A2P2I3E2_9CRUS